MLALFDNEERGRTITFKLHPEYYKDEEILRVEVDGVTRYKGKNEPPWIITGWVRSWRSVRFRDGGCNVIDESWEYVHFKASFNTEKRKGKIEFAN